jgi:hypothetical protein
MFYLSFIYERDRSTSGNNKMNSKYWYNGGAVFVCIIKIKKRDRDNGICIGVKLLEEVI